MPNNKPETRPAKTLTTPDGVLVYCLHVSNIPTNMSEQSLKNLYSKYGVIKKIFKQSKSHSPNSTYGFITYESPEDAYSAYVNRKVIRFRGRNLYTNIADSWHQPDGLTTDGQRTILKLAYVEFLKETQASEASEEAEEEDHNCEEETDNTIVCPIDKLNDDCLLNIFEIIPFSKRHVLSQVCSRWRNLMNNYWSKITKLDFKDEPFCGTYYSHNNLRLYLQLCPNITSVILSSKFGMTPVSSLEGPTADSIAITASLCHNLEELVIERIEMKNRPLCAVAHCCPYLRVLSITSCDFPRDDELVSVMKKCSNLEKLQISHSYMNPSNWLKLLRPGLKYVSLIGCTVNPFFLMKGLLNLKYSLEHLEIIVDSGLEKLDFKLFQGFPKLKTIIYSNSSSLLPQKSSPDMFCNLNRLELESNAFVTDCIIKGIVEHSPNLTVLNLSRSKNPQLTSNGLKELCKLSDLETLNLSSNEIDDEFLHEFSTNATKLERLVLNNCKKISDVGCNSIVSKIFKLKELHLDSCNVTNKTVSAALDAYDQNPDKEVLRMFVANTQITEIQMPPHNKVELSFSSVNCNWLHDGFFKDFSDFLFNDFDDDDDDDYYDDDDDDFSFGFYDGYDPEDYLLDMEMGDGMSPFEFYFNFM